MRKVFSILAAVLLTASVFAQSRWETKIRLKTIIEKIEEVDTTALWENAPRP